MNTYFNGTESIVRPWLSLHIFYGSERFQLLEACIAPLINEMLHEKIITEFFFIQYGEGGKHIRLRLLPAEPECGKIVEEKVHRVVSAYLLKEPSKRIAEGSTAEDLYPNNSIQQIAYKAELYRYGGPGFMASAERFFFHSSTFVFTQLKDIINSGYSSALLISVKMNLMLLRTLDLGERGAILLYRDIWYDWLQSGHVLFPDDTLSKEQKNKLLLETFERSFKQQYTVFYQLFEVYYLRLQPDELEAAEKQWLKHIKWLDNDFDTKHRLITGPFTTPDKNKLFILKSLIHMNNNRVRLLNHDESFLAFVIYQLLSQHGSI
ncbi:MAG: thiopeptide-type bacteriocin biosynthesis protein [Lewinella sp.]|nr:thiopeptide-type bacteriocin biosynthesis protein [Lewinella sp.]